MIDIVNAILYIFALIGMSVTIIYLLSRLNYHLSEYKKDKADFARLYNPSLRIINNIMDRNDLKITERLKLVFNEIFLISHTSTYYKNKDVNEYIDSIIKEIKPYLDKDEIMIEEL